MPVLLVVEVLSVMALRLAKWLLHPAEHPLTIGWSEGMSRCREELVMEPAKRSSPKILGGMPQQGGAHQVFEVMPQMDVVWDDDLLHDVDSQDGLLQQVAGSGEPLVDDERTTSVKLDISDKLRQVSDDKLLLDLGMNSVEVMFDEIPCEDDEFLDSRDLHHGLLQELAQGGEFIGAEETKPTAQLFLHGNSIPTLVNSDPVMGKHG